MNTENDRAEVGSDGGEGEGRLARPLTVPSEDDVGGINLGLLRRLVVPAEDLDLDDGGMDLDFAQQMLAVVRRPDPQRWFALINGYWMTTRLLPVASKTSEFGTDWYFVDPAARSTIRQYLKGVMVCPCFLVHARVWSIWIIPISSTKWWSGVEPLFRQGPEFYAENVFRVLADRSHGCYHIRHEPISELLSPATMPVPQTRPVSELLAEALGNSWFIDRVDHKVIRDLTRGKVLR